MANILILEDDDSFYAVEEAFATKLGHTVSRATNPDEFVAAGVNQSFDLVVMDMQFPGGGAPYAVRLISNNSKLAALPYLFCSGMPIDQVKQWFPESPKRRYIQKPPDFNEFKKFVSELLLQSPAPTAAAKLAAEPSPLAQMIQQEVQNPKNEKDANAVAARMADFILSDALRVGASDIHLDPDRNSVYVRYRIDGLLRDQAAYPKERFPVNARLRVLSNLPPTAAANAGNEEGSFDVPNSGRPVRARLSSFPCGHGEKLVMRLLDTSQAALSLDVLGFVPEVLEVLKRLISQPSGIFFTTGKTGSGKTMTLSSVMQFLNREDLNLMTLEDPIEFQIPRVNHAQINAKHGFTWADGLRGILRQDPNVIMVGEVRDAETAEIALRAATTGHKIFSTIHAANSAGVVTRLLGMGIEPFLISSGLIGSLAQRIVRRVCPNCAQPAPPPPDLVARFLKATDPLQVEATRAILSAQGGRWIAGRGCRTCFGTGYRGRVGAFELLPIDGPVRELIMRKATGPEIYEQGLKSGMRSLVVDLASKAFAGWTSLDEAYRAMAF